MRIACLQFDPQLKQVDANRAHAARLVSSRLRRGDVDLLLLPEMAFTGYCFRDRAEILPYSEVLAAGPTADWCADMARKLDCVVVAGFPELGGDGLLYNSQLAVNRLGRIVHVSRKRFLYMTDETWAAEGADFTTCDLPGLGPCAFGICMDLNPRKFLAPIDLFEFASALFHPPLAHGERPLPGIHELKANLILLSNNWLRSPADAAIGDEEHCQRLVTYWAYRLLPRSVNQLSRPSPTASASNAKPASQVARV